MKASQLVSLMCLVLGHGGAAAFQVLSPSTTSIRRRSFAEPKGVSTPATGQSLVSFSSTALGSTSSESTTSDDSPQQQQQQQPLDVDALLKYAGAIGTQMSLFYGLFWAVDALAAATGSWHVPFAVNCVVFWFAALKSRVLNPLNNSRPQRENFEANADTTTRKMPSWTPPGLIFPIMWILIIGPIRAATTAMVYSVTGTYANVAILSLMLHLSIGDCWNSINNVERRYGASVVGVLLVWLSKAHAAYRYYQVTPLAGKLLCLPLVWLTIASALIIRTWQINPDPVTGKPYPLYPVKGQGKTEFMWFQK